MVCASQLNLCTTGLPKQNGSFPPAPAVLGTSAQEICLEKYYWDFLWAYEDVNHMQVGRTSRVYHSTHKCCFNIHNLCILLYLGKRERKGANCANILQLRCCIQVYWGWGGGLKRKECREKRRLSKVSVPKMMERSWPENEGSQLTPGCQNALLWVYAADVREEALWRCRLQSTARLTPKTLVTSCSQICAKLAVIRVGVGMTEVLQTEVTGEGALSHRLKADRKESLWEFQGWLYLESAKPSPFQFKIWQTIVWRELNPREPVPLWYVWLPLVAVEGFRHPRDTALHMRQFVFWVVLMNSLTMQPY